MVLVYNNTMFNRLSTTMRSILIVLASVALTGCANTEWLTHSQHRDYKSYDPCIKCGEKWTQLPNEPFEAQKRYDRGERW